MAKQAGDLGKMGCAADATTCAFASIAATSRCCSGRARTTARGTRRRRTSGAAARRISGPDAGRRSRSTRRATRARRRLPRVAPVAALPRVASGAGEYSRRCERFVRRARNQIFDEKPPRVVPLLRRGDGPEAPPSKYADNESWHWVDRAALDRLRDRRRDRSHRALIAGEFGPLLQWRRHASVARRLRWRRAAGCAASSAGPSRSPTFRTLLDPCAFAIGRRGGGGDCGSAHVISGVTRRRARCTLSWHGSGQWRGHTGIVGYAQYCVP